MKAYIVDRAALNGNIQAVLKAAGDSVVWAVLKGNGYGLGILPMARMMKENGITHFAVTEVKEAEALRDGGYSDEQILMLRSTSNKEEINALLDLNVILSIGSYDTAVAVNGIAAERADVAEVHLNVDTGMGRYGFLPGETDKMISVYTYMKNLAVSGIYTHFHSAFCSHKATLRQYELFLDTVSKIRKAGFETGMVHCCNSAAFLNHPEMKLDAIRIGSAFLGRAAGAEKLNLARIGYAEAAIEEIRWLQEGQTVGYGAGFRVKAPVRAAVIGIGYFNGFGPDRENDLYRVRDSLRGMWNHFKNIFIRKWVIVTVNGHKCRVLGHIGMVHAVVDVTDIQCAVGDTAVVQVKPLDIKGMKIVYK